MRVPFVSAVVIFCVQTAAAQTPAQTPTTQPASPPPSQAPAAQVAPPPPPGAASPTPAPQVAPPAPTATPQPAPTSQYPGYVPYPAPAQPAPFGYPTYPNQNYPPSDPRPRFLPYQPGEPAPPGYRYDEATRQGPIIGGAITGGIPYLLGLLVASSENFSNKRGFLVIPGIGPWLTLLTRDSTCDQELPISECTEDFASRMVITIDGLLQTGGAILILSGVLNPKRRYVLEQYSSLQLSPRLYQGGAGLGASGQF